LKKSTFISTAEKSDLRLKSLLLAEASRLKLDVAACKMAFSPVNFRAIKRRDFFNTIGQQRSFKRPIKPSRSLNLSDPCHPSFCFDIASPASRRYREGEWIQKGNVSNRQGESEAAATE
jgi:hypothetical protein